MFIEYITKYPQGAFYLAIVNFYTVELPWVTTLSSNHLTKIPTGFSVRQIVISETSC